MSTTTVKNEPRFNTYSLLSFPEGIFLFDDTEKHVFTLMDINRPIILGQEIFTPSEALVMRALIANYPSYAPYENIYAKFYGKTLEESFKELHEGLEDGIWDDLLRPIRNVLSRFRWKARNVGFEIMAQLGVGYILFPIAELGVRYAKKH